LHLPEKHVGDLAVRSSLNSNKASFKYQSRPDALSGNVSIISLILQGTQRT